MTQANQWEYRVEVLGTAFRRVKEEEQEAILNDLGLEGWEVFYIHDPQGSNKITVYAKRPLRSTTRRSRTLPQEDW